jgi:hypothetical protein
MACFVFMNASVLRKPGVKSDFERDVDDDLLMRIVVDDFFPSWFLDVSTDKEPTRFRYFAPRGFYQF